MKPSKIDPLINDTELNYLADLFLSRYGFDLASPQYRYIRNAVVMYSYGTALSFEEMVLLLSDCENISYSAFIMRTEAALRALPRPINETYNKFYATPVTNINGGPRCVTMQPQCDLKYMFSFLGTVFLYITNVNYKRAFRIDISELKHHAAKLKKSANY